MNVPTSEFKALSDKVDEYKRNQTLLIRTLAMVLDASPDPVPQDCGPERPRLRLIRGGRR